MIPRVLHRAGAKQEIMEVEAPTAMSISAVRKPET
jgi:hypothetical protein